MTRQLRSSSNVTKATKATLKSFERVDILSANIGIVQQDSADSIVQSVDPLEDEPISSKVSKPLFQRSETKFLQPTSTIQEPSFEVKRPNELNSFDDEKIKKPWKKVYSVLALPQHAILLT